MRIQIVGPWAVSYIAEACARALQQLGHEVKTGCYGPQYRKDPSPLTRVAKRVQYWYPYLKAFREAVVSTWQINRSLLRDARRWRPHLCLVLKGEVFLPQTLAQLKRRYRALLVNWSFDDPFRFDSLAQSFPIYDHFFCFDSFYVSRLRQEGVQSSHYLPLAYDPHICKKLTLDGDDQERFGSDICFVGGMFRPRIWQFERLADLGLAIWGAGWKALPPDSPLKGKLRGEAWGIEMVKIYNASKIALNSNHYQSVYGTNSRTFEIPGCGAFELTDMKEDLPGLFEVGKEIACYEDVDQLVDLARYYLDHDREREAMAQRGRERAEREHTYLERMKTMMFAVLS